MADLRVPQLKRQLADKDRQLEAKDKQITELREQLERQQLQIEDLGRQLGGMAAAEADEAPKKEKKSLWRALVPKFHTLRQQSAPGAMAAEARVKQLEAENSALRQRSQERRPSSTASERISLEAKRHKAFEDSLEPVHLAWVLAPPSSAAAVVAARAELAEREQRWLAAAGADTEAAAAAELEAHVPVLMALLHTQVVAPRATPAQFPRLRTVSAKGSALFRGVYGGVHHMVANSDSYEPFCAELDAIEVDAERFPQRCEGGGGGGGGGGLMRVYASARRAAPLFGALLHELAERAEKDGAGAKVRVAPLKKIFRVLQKHATAARKEEEEKEEEELTADADFSSACDVVRGSVTCDRMDGLLSVLLALLAMQAAGQLRIVRVKNRFRRPTEGGWADAMINFVCRGEEHVCELQLVHAQLLKARKEFGGHNAYAAFREAAELLEYFWEAVAPAALPALREALPRDELALLDSHLNTAAEAGEIEEAAKQLALGADPDGVVGYMGGRALARASANGHADVIRLLVQRGCDLEHLTKHSNSPLMLAANFGHRPAASALLEAGALCEGEPGANAVAAAASRGHVEMVRLLLDHGAALELPQLGTAGAAADAGQPPPKSSAGHGKSALTGAARGEHFTMVEFLIDAGAPVDGDGGQVALQAACQYGKVLLVKKLLACGVPVEVRAFGDKHLPPLASAARSGHVDVMRLLLEGCGHGTPLDLGGGGGGSEVKPPPADVVAAFREAALYGQCQVLRLLVEECGLPLNTVVGKKGATALSSAGTCGHVEAVRTLLELGPGGGAAEGVLRGLMAKSAKGGNRPLVDLLATHGVPLPPGKKEKAAATTNDGSSAVSDGGAAGAAAAVAAVAVVAAAAPAPPVAPSPAEQAAAAPASAGSSGLPSITMYWAYEIASECLPPMEQLLDGTGLGPEHMQQRKDGSGPKPLHVTIAFAPTPEQEAYWLQHEHEEVELAATGVAWDGSATALTFARDFSPPKMDLGHLPHVTLALAPGTKASYSNDMLHGEHEHREVAVPLRAKVVRFLTRSRH